jgi:hypothetical protein
LCKECAGIQNKYLNSFHITEIWHKERVGNQKNAIFLHTETLHLYSKESYSAKNDQILDKESTLGMEFCRELPDPERGTHRRNGITGSWTRNPPEEGNSAGIYCIKDMDSDRQEQKTSDR